VIVADASPLIFLGRIEHLFLLPELFDSVLVPGIVFHEVTGFGERPGALAVRAAKDQGLIKVIDFARTERVDRLVELVDAGEAYAIALAIERGITQILMDDLVGRRLSQSRGLAPIGTLGVLVQAKRRGLITDLKPLLDAVESAGLRMTPTLRIHIEQLAEQA